MGYASAVAQGVKTMSMPTLPKKGVFGAGIKPPVISIDKPQACLDSLHRYNRKLKREKDSIRLHHPEVTILGEMYGMRRECVIPVDIDFFEVAKSKKLKNGDRVRSLIIQTKDADKLAIAAEQSIFSPNSEMCVYSKTEKKIHVMKKMHTKKRITTPTVTGSEIIIEYKEKNNIKIQKKNYK